MRSHSIRLKPIHAVLAFALLALIALAVSAAAPTPVEGNMSKPEAGAVAPQFSLVDQNGKTHKLADSTFATAKSYGVLTQRGTAMMATRDTFLISPDGKVAKHYDVTAEKLPGHSAELLTDIEAFKAKKG